MPASAAVVPADSEELFRVYHSYVRSLVRRRPGIPAQEVDDIASEIMTRILERDVLGMFDPSKHIEYQGQTVPPNFRTFLSGIVLRYIRGQHDKYGRRIKHETAICDAPAGDNGVRWIDLFGGFIADDYPSLTDSDFVTRLRTYLAMVPPRNAHDNLNLVELFDELCAEMFVDGKIHPRYIKQRFGISSSTVQVWMAHLREVLEPLRAGEDAPPLVIPEPLEVNGITLTLADCQSALAILGKVKGMHFKGDLLKAGHPLGDPALNVKGEEWYHPIARAEMKAYPECKLPPTPGGASYHTKQALVHWLERILEQAGHQADPEPEEPEEPLTNQELLEAELWSCGRDAAWVDRCLALAGMVPA